ncbi:MAG: hypothetical protein ABIJ96_05215 [Elusimicrobiota bacterium]
MERRWLRAGWAAVIPVLIMPIADPDLWWHLSAARWMIDHFAWLRTDALAATQSGLEWINFEWLSQLAFYGAGWTGGLTGLWLLKILLLAGTGAALLRTLRHIGVPPPARALGFAVWAAAMAARSDIRTELFSFVLFAWLLCGLERKGRVRMPPAAALFMFAFWSNLHAGFIYGLLLLAAYAYEDYRRGGNSGLLTCWLAAAAGTFINPYGWGVHRVLVRHALETGGLAPYIDEWGPLAVSNSAHWPVWLLMLGLAALAARRLRRRAALPLGPAILLVVFAAAALRHSRLAPYFALCAVVYVFRFAAGDREVMDAVNRGRTAALALVLVAVFALWQGGARVAGGIFSDVYTPVRAAAYLERHPELAGLRLYSAWGWGGYLGYRLGGRVRLLQDGRYIFHSLLMEGGAAAEKPDVWQVFLKRRGADAALLQNRPTMMGTTRVYPDGSRRAIPRPYYIQYMPRPSWALVYWDEKALLFVRRERLKDTELAPLEYQLLLPRDGAARQDALARGEISREQLKKERLRLRAETADPPRRPALR